VIRDNLLDGISFLKEQDRLLAFAGQLLDELRSLSGCENPETILRRQILLQGLADIPSARFKQALLFGNGTGSPLKIHVVKDGERKPIEIEQANLRQPGFQSVLQCGSSGRDARFAFRPGLAASAIAEIINLRFRNQRQTHRLDAELTQVEGNIACSETSRLRLFGHEFSAGATVPKGPFRKIGETARRLGGALIQRLKAFRPDEPVWEEISHATLTTRP